MATSLPSLSKYTTVFRAKNDDGSTPDNAEATSLPPPGASRRKARRRNRATVACEPCRLRKKKCDRQHPCIGCTGRGDKCHYAAAPFWSVAGGGGTGTRGGSGGSISKKNGWMPVSGGAVSRHEAQVRLQRLEDMVSELIGRAQGASGSRPLAITPSSSSASGPSPASSASSLPARGGEVQPQGGSGTVDTGPWAGEHLSGDERSTRTAFIGATHWSALLQNIRDVQGYLEHEITDEPQPTRVSRPPSPRPTNTLEPDFLVENRGRVTTREILDALPPRPECDKLLLAYFLNEFVRAPMLHSIQFQRRYVAFWDRPEATSVLWVSMLFSVLYMSASIGLAREASRSGGEGIFFPPRDMGAWPEMMRIEGLRVMAARCLVAGDYLKGHEYAVEALSLCSFLRLYSIEGETDPMLWAGVSSAIRLAQHLGYHRDPRQLLSSAAVGCGGQERPVLSAFAGEMRRRTWATLEIFDCLLSFRYGVPTVIHGDDTDTDGPTNLIDTDFDEHTTVLPPARPSTDPTPMVYSCYKTRSMRLVRRLVRHALKRHHHQQQHDTASSPSYRQTMTLDSEVRAQIVDMPASLRLVLPISEHAPLTDTPPRIIHRVAADLMNHKALCVLHRAYLTGGGEATDPRLGYSRDTCRASALRILEVQADIEKELRPGGRLHGEDYLLRGLVKHDFLLAATILCLDLVESSSAGTISLDDQSKKLEALETSYKFWHTRRHSSRDASYAVKVLGAILAKVRKSKKDLVVSTGEPLQQHQRQHQNNTHWPASMAPPVSPSAPSSAQTVHADYAAPENLGEQDFPYDLPLDEFLAINVEDIDWNIIDSFLLDRQSTLIRFKVGQSRGRYDTGDKHPTNPTS